MVDPEDRRLPEDAVQRRVERTSRPQIPAERFLDDHPGPVGTMRRAEELHDIGEERGRDRQVVEWVLRLPELGSEAAERVRIVVGSGDESKLLLESAEDILIDGAVRF